MAVPSSCLDYRRAQACAEAIRKCGLGGRPVRARKMRASISKCVQAKRSYQSQAQVTPGIKKRGLRRDRLETRQEPLFGLGCGPWGEVVLFGCRREAGIAAEQTFCFCLSKAGEFRGLKICGAPIGVLDLLRDFI